MFSNIDYHICVDVPPSSLYGYFFRGAYTLQYGHWMVGRCPTSWNDVIIKSLCEAPADGSDLVLWLPVVSSYDAITSFRNIYCAMCHSVPLSTLTSWEITLDARKNIIKAWKDVNDSVGILEVLNSSHSFNQELIEFKPLNKDASRACLNGVIESCPMEYNNQFVIGQCQSYMDVVVQPVTEVIYRNWYCALCNDAVDPQINICQTFKSLPSKIVTTSLTALVDFRENKQSHSYFNKDIQTACNRSEFLDPFSLRCRSLHCSRGFLLENGVCVGQPLKDFLEITNQRCISTGYTELELDMCLAGDEDIVNPCEFWGKCLQTTAMRIGQCKSQTEDLSMDLENNCTRAVRLILMVNATARNVSNVLADLLSEDNSKWCQSEASVQQAVVKTGCLPTSNVTCHTYHSYDDNNVYFTSWNNSEALFLRDFNALYSLEETFYQITYNQLSQGPLHRAPNVTICGDPFILNCSLVALTSSEFAKFMEVEQLTDYNHLILETGGALVCHHLVSNKPQRVHGYTIVTIICITLSMLALIASFITYLVFPSLRNLPGRCVMSLIGAVFCGQLLLLITGDDVARSVSEAFCAVLAVLLHYSWLSTFSWTNVLAFYLARALGPKAKPSAAGQHRHSLLFFSLFGWGLPLVIVIICVILHFVPNLNLHYGVSVEITDTLSCNMTDRSVRIAAILVPICVSLLANAVLFVRILTGFTFRRTPSSNIYSREAQKTRTRRDAFISIKVSVPLLEVNSNAQYNGQVKFEKCALKPLDNIDKTEKQTCSQIYT